MFIRNKLANNYLNASLPSKSLNAKGNYGLNNKQIENLTLGNGKLTHPISAKNIGDVHVESRIKHYDPIELIKRRLDALKLLQVKSAKLEAKFYEDIYLLECNYNSASKSLKEARRNIVTGTHEPTDEECKLAFESKLSPEELKEKENNRDSLALSLYNQAAKIDNVKGLPDFWLTVLKRVGLTSQMIEEHDEPVLKYLYDVDIDLVRKKPYSFTLNFYFLPNEYFTNDVLTKTYEFKIEVDENEPYLFDAPETVASIGCVINWKKGRDVTRHCETSQFDVEKPRDDKRESFFNFFDTIETTSDQPVGAEAADGDDFFDQEAELAIDYEVGYTFKEKIIPRAILYYTGEITDDVDMSDEEEDDDNENENDNQSDLIDPNEKRTSAYEYAHLNKY